MALEHPGERHTWPLPAAPVARRLPTGAVTSPPFGSPDPVLLDAGVPFFAASGRLFAEPEIFHQHALVKQAGLLAFGIPGISDSNLV